jgi:hypothetical protein
MVEMDVVFIFSFTPALGEWGKQEHANGAIAELSAVLRFIPDDEQCATLLVLV